MHADNIASVFERVEDGRPALLFGLVESEWLWLTRRNRTYCIQLTLYPRYLKALRPAFERAAQKAGVTVEEQAEGRKDALVCRLGSDPQAAGKLAWAVFTDTMGLEWDANVSMKWL